MPIPGSPGIPYDWEIIAADCETLGEYAKAIVDLAIKLDAIARNSEEDLSARTGALIGLAVLKKKYRILEGMWGVRSCGGDIPGPMPGGVVDERWPPQFPY